MKTYLLIWRRDSMPRRDHKITKPQEQILSGAGHIDATDGHDQQPISNGTKKHQAMKQQVMCLLVPPACPPPPPGAHTHTTRATHDDVRTTSWAHTGTGTLDASTLLKALAAGHQAHKAPTHRLHNVLRIKPLQARGLQEGVRLLITHIQHLVRPCAAAPRPA